MTDLERILPLWKELDAAGEDYVLATVVAVEGPSYRKPGACMLVAHDGRRAGAVSGGCLESEVARRAWWLTEKGPSVQRHSTVEEDGDRPYGSGCGGVIWLLLERRATARAVLIALEQSFRRRIPLATATILEGEQLARRAFAGLDSGDLSDPSFHGSDTLQHLAELALAGKASLPSRLLVNGAEVRVFAGFRPARRGLWIFGAGDDAQPLLDLAKTLGWYISVADGRSQLATRQRFLRADELHVLGIGQLSALDSGVLPSALSNLRPHDAAVVMNHSFEQDSRVLASLLSLPEPLAYTGVLGPQRRTRELLLEAARLLNLPADSAGAMVDRWLAQLHAPTGLDLGADSPQTIALSVVAEIQKSFARASALPLCQVRAAGAFTPN